MALQVRIEPASLADFNAAIRHFVDELKFDMETVNRQQMRLMCRDAMTFTPPMPKGGGQGLTSKAHKAGMNKLGNDVQRIFIPADSPNKGMPVLLRQIINSVRADDQEGFRAIYDRKSTLSKVSNLSPVMRKIMQDTSYTRAYAKAKNYLNKANIYGQVRQVAGFTSDLRGIHDRYKGAVNGRWPKNAPLGGPQYFVDSMDTLKAYIANRQLKVGRVKAGWAQLLSMVPMPVNKKGVAINSGSYKAPWVDANKAGNRGIFQTSRSGNRIGMSVTNLIGNINNISNEAGTENIVYGNRVKQIRAAVQEYLFPTIKKANRRRR